MSRQDPAPGFDLAAALAERRRQGLYREPRTLSAAAGVEAQHDGRRYIVFCSNDYLGLAHEPRLAEALRAAAAEHGVGSGAAHLVSGHHPLHEALEERLAAFVGRERALLFSTGYMANLGVIDALLGRGDHCFQDRLNHASLLDGARLSGARLHRYRHAAPGHLGERLQRGAGRRLVATDGVFSMDGDVAPLSALARTAAEHGAWLMVDDAHGIGVTGPRGGGSVAAAGLSQAEVPVLVGTLGKALGTAGAFVAGSAELIDYLVQTARTYIYTTAQPPALAAATLEAVDIAHAEDWRRERLRAHVRRFRREAAAMGFQLLASETPIQPVLLGGAAAATAASEQLRRAGLWVTAIRPPTVPAGQARLRITFSAAHSDEHVDRLLDALAELPRDPA